MFKVTAGPNVTPDSGHTNCRRCGGFNLKECAACHNCQDCCTCAFCEDCGIRHPINRGKEHGTLCAKCGVCLRSGRCTCSKRVGEIYLDQYVLGNRSLTRISTLPNRCTTVELELSSYTPMKTRMLDGIGTGWSVCRADFHRDSTIQGPAPIELVLGPITGPDLPLFQQELAVWLKKSRAQVNTSCGMHVHVDARKLDPFGMRRLLRLYRVLEPMFFGLCDPRRISSQHCSPISARQWNWYGESESVSTARLIKECLILGTYLQDDLPRGYDRSAAVQSLVKSHTVKLGNNGRELNRYRSLNVHSWFYRGTLEFRCHEGCVDPARIVSWMELCRWTVELAQRLRDCEVTDIVTGTGPQHRFLQGSWERPYGTLSLPEEVREFVAHGRGPVPKTWEEQARELQTEQTGTVATRQAPAGPADYAPEALQANAAAGLQAVLQQQADAQIGPQNAATQGFAAIPIRPIRFVIND